MKYLTIKPVLGLKNDCPINHGSLFQVEDPPYNSVYLTHDTGGQNIDYERKRGACGKAYGRVQWSNSANAQKTKCLGLCELFNGTNRDYIYCDNGKIYVYDGSRDPVDTNLATPVTFAADNIDLYSIITFGGYFIFADRGEHTPYKWKHGDTYLTKLILAGTEYKFRYLMHLGNRIIGAYSDQDNGDLEIRYTDILPAWATLTFAAASQLYKPEGDHSITGLGKIGHNTGFVFSDEDISRLDYYSAAKPVYKAVRMFENWGSVNHQAIVSDGVALYSFDKSRGFFRFDGGEPQVISDDIEEIIASIGTSYYNLIFGKYIPHSDEMCWTIPANGSATPNKFLFLNRKTKGWRVEDKVARCLDVWQTFSDETWTELAVLAGGVWPGEDGWTKYTTESRLLVMGNTDGHLYMRSSEADVATDIDGYRIEPIIPFPDPKQFKRILEIWIDCTHRVDADLDFYWRGGNTVSEVKNAKWNSIGLINMNAPTEPVLYPDLYARLHQFKWGTDKKDEPFSIDAIRFGYYMQGQH